MGNATSGAAAKAAHSQFFLLEQPFQTFGGKSFVAGVRMIHAGKDIELNFAS